MVKKDYVICIENYHAWPIALKKISSIKGIYNTYTCIQELHIEFNIKLSQKRQIIFWVHKISTQNASSDKCKLHCTGKKPVACLSCSYCVGIVIFWWTETEKKLERVHCKATQNWLHILLAYSFQNKKKKLPNSSDFPVIF